MACHLEMQTETVRVEVDRMPLELLELDSNMLSDRLDVTYYLVREKAMAAIPDGEPLASLCKPVRTKTPPRDQYCGAGVPCLKLRNVRGSLLSTDECEFVPERVAGKYVKAKRHDIILTATGEGTAGRADIFLEESPYIVTGENIILRVISEKVNPFYLLGVLRTPIVSRQLSQYVRGATGQTHLYWQDVSKIAVPIIDKDKQKRFEERFLQALEFRRQSDLALGEFAEMAEETVTGN